MRARKLTFRGGWGCLVLLAILLVPEIFQLATRSRAPGQTRTVLLGRLTGRYSRQLLRDSSPSAPDFAARIAAINNAQITSFSLRTCGPGATVRVTVALDGAPPPDGMTTRYFTLKQTLWGSWWVAYETDAAFYNLRPY